MNGTRFTNDDFKAISWLCRTLDARPCMTVYPTVTVQLKATGEVIERDIYSMRAEYRTWQAQDLKERARDRRQEEYR